VIAVGDQARGRGHADERPARERPSRLGRLEQKGAGPTGCQFAVDADRRLPIGEEDPVQRHQSMGTGKLRQFLDADHSLILPASMVPPVKQVGAPV
jgi:hypothetical protein